jgi:hypothetical protein
MDKKFTTEEYLALLEENESLSKEVLSEMAHAQYWQKAYLETWDYRISNQIVNLRIRLGRLRVKVCRCFNLV